MLSLRVLAQGAPYEGSGEDTVHRCNRLFPVPSVTPVLLSVHTDGASAWGVDLFPAMKEWGNAVERAIENEPAPVTSLIDADLVPIGSCPGVAMDFSEHPASPSDERHRPHGAALFCFVQQSSPHFQPKPGAAFCECPAHALGLRRDRRILTLDVPQVPTVQIQTDDIAAHPCGGDDTEMLHAGAIRALPVQVGHPHDLAIHEGDILRQFGKKLFRR